MNQSHVSDFGTDAIGKLLIGAAYFQVFGKATPALLLTLSRQAFFFIPLIFILFRFNNISNNLKPRVVSKHIAHL